MNINWKCIVTFDYFAKLVEDGYEPNNLCAMIAAGQRFVGWN